MIEQNTLPADDDMWWQQVNDDERREYEEWLDAYESETQQLREEREMPSYVSDTGGGEFKMVPEGVHIAVCDMVVNLGIQETNFGSKNQHYIRWEIPAELIETDDGPKPMVIGNFYTSSLSEKANLRHDLEAWRGRGFTKEELEKFDLMAVLGKACQLQVIHRTKNNGKMGAFVQSVMGLPKGTQAPKPTMAIGYDSNDQPETFDKLPDWLQKKVIEGHDRVTPEAPAPEHGNVVLDDDIPFK